MTRRLLAALLVAWPTLVAAQPNVSGVSGTVSHGSSITITGTSFGSKATAAPLKYDDFQGTTVGNSPSGWGVQGDAGYPKVGTTRLRSGTPFTKNLEHMWGIGNASNLHLLGIGPITKLYVDFWRYFDVSSGGTLGSLNIKTIRVHTAGTGAPDHYSQEYEQTGPLRPRNMDGVSGWPVSGADNGYSSCSYGQGSDITGIWVHWQWGIDIGSGNGAGDGKQLAFWNSQDCYTMGANGIPSTIKMSESGQPPFDELFVGNYVRGGDYSGTLYAQTEALYVDTTWARVELCDASTYAARTHCEIQIPSAWSGTSITATVNRGSFGAGTAYVYVCNDAGTCDSTGHAVTVSTGGGATVPDAPTIGTATPGNAQCSVAFTPPGSDGGATITGYTATSSPGGFTGTGAGSPVTVSGLSNGVGYTFTVVATNSQGDSSASSASNTCTPVASTGKYRLRLRG